MTWLIDSRPVAVGPNRAPAQESARTELVPLPEDASRVRVHDIPDAPIPQRSVEANQRSFSQVEIIIPNRRQSSLEVALCG